MPGQLYSKEATHAYIVFITIILLLVSVDQPPANPDVDKLPSYEDVCPSGLTDNEPPPYIDTPPPHISLLLPLSPTSSDTTVPSPVPQNSPDPSWSSQENDLDTNTPTLVPQNSPDPYWRSQENGLVSINNMQYEKQGMHW